MCRCGVGMQIIYIYIYMVMTPQYCNVHAVAVHGAPLGTLTVTVPMESLELPCACSNCTLACELFA